MYYVVNIYRVLLLMWVNIGKYWEILVNWVNIYKLYMYKLLIEEGSLKRGYYWKRVLYVWGWVFYIDFSFIVCIVIILEL